jgi:chromosomal replication initiation ATPase DnaA
MTIKPVQMPLDLGGAPAYSAADFLVADGNRDAVACLEQWRAWPVFAHVLVGPEGSGKTHLAHLFSARTGAPITAAAVLNAAAVPTLAAALALIVEDGDRGVDQTALLHLFNLLRERGRTLLLTARIPPARWPITLPDLRSRLAALPVVAIGAPDEALLAAVLVKLFADRQTRVGQDLVAYLVSRLERSFAAARAAVATLDRAALEQQRPITVPLAREVLGLIPDPPAG